MMVATLNGNPRASIISCYGPTNIREETELIVFHDELYSLVRCIPKHNVLVIGGTWIRKLEKTETTNTAYATHQTGMDNI